MATKNSATAVLGVDIAPMIKALKEADKIWKEQMAKMAKTPPPQVNPWTTAASNMKVPPAATAYGKALGAFNGTLTVNGKLIKNSSEAMKKMGDVAKGGAGQGILQLGYALDDLQYGIKGVANNIPQLVQSLTGSMKMAGFVGIAVTAGTVLFKLGQEIWDAAEGSKALAEANDVAAASFARLTKKMVEQAEARGEAKAEEEKGKAAETDKRRKIQDDVDERANRMRAAKDEVKMAKAGVLEGAAKQREEMEITHAAEVDSATSELERVTTELNADEKEAARLREEVITGQQELSALEEKKAAIEEHNAFVAEQEKLQPQINTPEGRSAYIREYGQVPAAPMARQIFTGGEEARRAELARSVPGMRETLGNVRERYGELWKRRGDLKQRLEGELPEKKKAAETGIAIEEGKEREKQAAEDTKKEVLDGFNKIVDGYEEIEKAAKANKKEIEKAAKETSSKAKALMKAIEDAVKEVGKAMEERREKTEKGDKVLRDLGISEIKSASRRKRAERVAKIADKTNELIKGGMDPAVAADAAERLQKVEDRAKGDRTIRTNAPVEGQSGLDWLKSGPRGHEAMMADSNVPTPLEAAQTRGKAAIARAKAEAAKVGGGAADSGREAAGYLKAMLDKFDLLIKAVEKTPAEKAQPVSKN